MISLDLFAAWAITSYRRARGQEPDRGDVPGWVMVTVMTAGLVVVIFVAFKGKITQALDHAMTTVTDGTQ